MDFRENDMIDPIEKTCAWLLKHGVYLRWLNEHRGLLWLKGKPGAGKSTLLRYALKQQKTQDMLVIASFFVHGRGAPIQKNREGLFRSLLFQILQRIPDSLSSHSTWFKSKCDTQGKVEEKWQWQANKLQDLFKTYVTNAIEKYSLQIFIDALDECGEDVAIDLVDFFRQLMDELPHTKASFRVCFSCRHYPLVALENGLEICVEDQNREDIEIYVRNKIENGIQDKVMSKKLQKDILQKSLNVFQWVVLVVPQIILLYKKGKSLISIGRALRTIPTKLNELYQEVLRGIDESEKPQSLQLMQWICFALRPLSLDELRFAIAVDADTPHDSLSKCKATEEYAYTNEEMQKRINDLSKGLAEVREYDNKKIAQFVHQSVSDYLIEGGLNILTNKTVSEDVLGPAHFRLSRSCIRYLIMKEIVGAFSIQQHEWSSVGNEFPFLRYAVTSWVAHAEYVEKAHIPQRDLLKIFNQRAGDNFRAWVQMYRQLEGFSPTCPDIGETLLHIASKYGFCDCVGAILDTDDAEPNARDMGDRTPLWVAAANGHETVVKLLLAQKNIAPNLADSLGSTPLHSAAMSGHVEVVQLLLARNDVNPNSINVVDCTPLQIAASHGHVEIVKLLLAREDIDPNLASHQDETPHSLAALFRRVEIVKLLLCRKDIEVQVKTQSYENLMQTVKQKGYKEVLELLESARLNRQ